MKWSSNLGLEWDQKFVLSFKDSNEFAKLKHGWRSHFIGSS